MPCNILILWHTFRMLQHVIYPTHQLVVAIGLLLFQASRHFMLSLQDGRDKDSFSHSVCLRSEQYSDHYTALQRLCWAHKPSMFLVQDLSAHIHPGNWTRITNDSAADQGVCVCHFSTFASKIPFIRPNVCHIQHSEVLHKEWSQVSQRKEKEQPCAYIL